MFKAKTFIVTSVLRSLAKRYQCYCKIPWLLSGKEFAYNTGAVGLIRGSGGSPGEGNGDPLQYSCSGNPVDREAWRVIVHGVTKSWTRLSD